MKEQGAFVRKKQKCGEPFSYKENSFTRERVGTENPKSHAVTLGLGWEPFADLVLFECCCLE